MFTAIANLYYQPPTSTEKLIKVENLLFKQFQHLEVVCMASQTDEKEMLEKFSKIEEMLGILITKIDDLTHGMRIVYETIYKSDLLRTGTLRDYRGLPSKFYEDSGMEIHKKPPSPWTRKSIESFSKDRRINIDFEILADPETLLPTLKALKTNLNGLTAEEVSQITERSRATEANYLSKMYKLGLLDKARFGKNTKYRLSEKMIPPSIRNQI